jgi:hypothetical protein
MRHLLSIVLLSLGVTSSVVQADDATPAETKADAKSTETPKQELFSGKVVFVRDALKRKGIKAYDELDKQVALETAHGELIPIIPDWRGRAFFQDKRLRDRKVDLVGYRRDGVPYLQVLMVFVYNDKGERQYMDYWCDICAIPMYEIKPCDCCQGPIELRFQTRDLPDYLGKTVEDKGQIAKD